MLRCSGEHFTQQEWKSHGCKKKWVFSFTFKACNSVFCCSNLYQIRMKIKSALINGTVPLQIGIKLQVKRCDINYWECNLLCKNFIDIYCIFQEKSNSVFLQPSSSHQENCSIKHVQCSELPAVLLLLDKRLTDKRGNMWFKNSFQLKPKSHTGHCCSPTQPIIDHWDKRGEGCKWILACDKSMEKP